MEKQHNGMQKRVLCELPFILSSFVDDDDDDEEDEDEDDVGIDVDGRAGQTPSRDADSLGQLNETLPPLLPPQTLSARTPATSS